MRIATRARRSRSSGPSSRSFARSTPRDTWPQSQSSRRSSSPDRRRAAPSVERGTPTGRPRADRAPEALAFSPLKAVTHPADTGCMSLIDGAREARISARQQDTLRRRATDTVVAGPIGPGPLRRDTDGWLERWMETIADLARLKRSHPMLDAVIDEQEGRRIRIGEHWLFDFASCNYLGFDLDPEIIATVPEYLARW